MKLKFEQVEVEGFPDVTVRVAKKGAVAILAFKEFTGELAVVAVPRIELAHTEREIAEAMTLPEALLKQGLTETNKSIAAAAPKPIGKVSDVKKTDDGVEVTIEKVGASPGPTEPAPDPLAQLLDEHAQELEPVADMTKKELVAELELRQWPVEGKALRYRKVAELRSLVTEARK